MNVIIIRDESNDIRCFCRQVNTFKNAREREREREENARNVSIVLYRWQLVINAFTRDEWRCWSLVELCLSTSHSLFVALPSIVCLSVWVHRNEILQYSHRRRRKREPERTNETYVSTTTPTRRHSFTRCCHNYLSVNAHTYTYIEQQCRFLFLIKKDFFAFFWSKERERKRHFFFFSSSSSSSSFFSFVVYS